MSSGYSFFGPGEFAYSDFLFTYGAVFIFIACYLGYKLKGFRGLRSFKGVQAADMDFVSDVEEMEVMTVEAEEKRENTPRSRFQNVMDKVF